MKPGTNTRLVRAIVEELSPYVPGEQLQIKGLIKLNTNENPYPPSPKVLQAIKQSVDERLRLYPNPTSQPLRERLATFHKGKPENIIVGNGSDELLAMAVRAFVEPARSGAGDARRSRSKTTVQFFYPSYSLYPVLAAIHGAKRNAVPLNADFSIPNSNQLKHGKKWDFDAALTFITTPNAPSGRCYTRSTLEQLCNTQNGVVVLDEAYVDFAEENALSLGLKHPHVLVARTFSKAYSLCFQRIGYFVGAPALIGALDKIRDSYNVNGLGQLAACETLNHLPYYRANFQRVIQTREQLNADLQQLGFEVFPSQTNFILVKPPRFSAEDWLRKLKQRKILVRWFSDERLRDYLRISIGTQDQCRRLVEVIRKILRSASPP